MLVDKDGKLYWEVIERKPLYWYVLGDRRFHFGGWTGYSEQDVIHDFVNSIYPDNAEKWDVKYLTAVPCAKNIEEASIFFEHNIEYVQHINNELYIFHNGKCIKKFVNQRKIP